MAVAGERPEGVRVTAPRPGHADFGRNPEDRFRRHQGYLGARKAPARPPHESPQVAFAKAFLAAWASPVSSYVESIGSVAMAPVDSPADVDAARLRRANCAVLIAMPPRR